jgi:hypothetical protein
MPSIVSVQNNSEFVFSPDLRCCQIQFAPPASHNIIGLQVLHPFIDERRDALLPSGVIRAERLYNLPKACRELCTLYESII